VKELAAVLDYEPNNYAVQLRTQQSNVIGIMVPSVDNFFYDSFIAAVEEDARLHGYSVMIMQSRDKAQLEASNLHLFRKNRVMGLFVAVSIETEDITPFQKLEELKIPVVFFDRVTEEEGYHKVCLADADAARIAAEAIIRKKKKNVFAIFGHPHLSITKIRCATFKETFETKSPVTKVSVGYSEGSAESKQVVLEMLKAENRPDVIFCMGDLHLIGTMYAVHELKLKVPEDIAIISISNGLFPTLYNPTITYVETSGYKLGKLAFTQMLSCLRNENTPEEVMLDALLVEGGSL
ncbi:MAG: LacI family transcriptional regulator, partial [Chitinophagaceae bacterium]